MKFQLAYRGDVVEIHHARCREIGWGRNVRGAVIDAPNPYGAAVDAWSHKHPEGDALVFTNATFFPCLAAPSREAPPETEIPAVGLRDSLETKVDVAVAWAEEHNWDVKDLGQSLELSRGDEFLVMAWDGNRWDSTMSAWTFDGRTTRMPSMSDALRRIAGHPEDAAEPEARKKPERRPTMRSVPFALDDLEVEILAAVAGRKLVWLNSLTGEEETASVMERGKQTKLSESSSGRRILTFCDSGGTGYRSVALDALIAVK